MRFNKKEPETREEYIGRLIYSGSRALSYTISARKQMPRAVKWLLIVIAGLAILNGLYCVFFLTPSVLNFLPAVFGCLIIVTLVFSEHILSFIQTKIGRICCYILCIAVSFNLVAFTAFAGVTLGISASIPEKNLDAIIVLGAGLRGGRVSVTLQARLNKALEYYAENSNAIFVVTGGMGPGETTTEAAAMSSYLIARGVLDSKILLEAQAESTEENFIYSKQLLDKYFGYANYRVLYVTNRFHVYRSGQYAKKAGLDAQPLAAPSEPVYLLPNNYFREYLAVAYYLVFNR
jgi:uncharacterized SAM-binding protein YcdF (DUF218 family)